MESMWNAYEEILIASVWAKRIGDIQGNRPSLVFPFSSSNIRSEERFVVTSEVRLGLFDPLCNRMSRRV